MNGEIAHIGHVELLTPRFDESLEFFTGILGLAVVGESGRSAYLRGYGDYERVGFELTDSPEAGLGHAAFRARSADALQACVRRFEGVGGRPGTWIDGDIGHGPAYQFRNPEGHLIEVYFETERQPSASGLPKNRVDRRGRGAIGVSRVDHFNLFSHDVAADRQFAETHLGVRTLDLIVDDGRETGAFTTLTIKPLELVFVLDSARRAGRLHHLAFWVDTREEVLRAADVFLEHGVPIEVAPALHTIGQSFFLYGFEPGGNRIEVTTGADFHFDPDGPPRIWSAEERRAGIGWGTSFPETWRSYGTSCRP